LVKRAKAMSERLEKIDEEEVEANENEIRRAKEDEEERRRQLHRYEEEIQALETQLASADDEDPTLVPKMNAVQGEAKRLTLKKADLKARLESCEFEKKGAQRRLDELAREKNELQNVARLKFETLKKLGMGRDACEGVKWLRKNKEQFQVSHLTCKGITFGKLSRERSTTPC